MRRSAGSSGRRSSARGRSIASGVISRMTAQVDAQLKAATAAARARRLIAERITELVPAVENDDLAQVVLHLAEAYAHLAMEPPRSRAG